MDLARIAGALAGDAGCSRCAYRFVNYGMNIPSTLCFQWGEAFTYLLIRSDKRVNAIMSTDTLQIDAPVERLPFRVEIASADDLMDVARLRAATYGKHLPALAAKLLQPEAADFEIGNEVFVAKSRLDGSLLGSFRTHANTLKPLPLEASMDLPDHFSGCRMIEATRLSVVGNPDSSLVRNALFKTFYQYCLAQRADWMLAAGRRPVDRLYDMLLFTDVEGPGTFYPMAHASGVPHRVMCLSPGEADGLWRAVQHPLYRFTVQTTHPDINLSHARDLDDVLRDIDASVRVADPGQHQSPASVPTDIVESVQQVGHARVARVDKERHARISLSL